LEIRQFHLEQVGITLDALWQGLAVGVGHHVVEEAVEVNVVHALKEYNVNVDDL